MGRVLRQLQHSWNLFKDGPREMGYGGGYTQSPRSSRSPARYYSDRSFIGSIYNRMAVDFAQVEFMHVRLDPKNDVAVEVIRDDLHNVLTLSPNIDQSALALKIDYAMTMFEQGVAALVPVDASMDPLVSGSYDIQQLRVGTVASWHPRHVTLNVYDDREYDKDGLPINGGIVKQMTVPKEICVIQENPWYTVMNEPNGLVQRLMSKLTILDTLDEAVASGDLDLILQLPYTVRGESRQVQAKKRRDELRQQLKDDELGIGYIDVSEKVIQLNRPIENKLLEQIEYLMKAVKSELGITEEIMNSSADQDQINNYYDRTIEPIATGLALEAKRKFLTKTAISQRQSVEIYRDPLKLIPLKELPEVVDKLLRNAAITANEIRPKIGFMPSDDPRANELANPNMPTEDQPKPDDVPVKAPVKLVPKEVADGAGLPGDAAAGAG